MKKPCAQYRHATVSTIPSSVTRGAGPRSDGASPRCAAGPDGRRESIAIVEPPCTLRAISVAPPIRIAGMDILARHAEAHPDTPALIDGEHRLSWREYHEARNRL